MKIRLLREPDLAEYKRLRLLSLQTDPGAFHLRYEDAKKLGDVFFREELLEGNPQESGFWGCFDPELVGMISLQKISAGTAKIFTLYVSPAFRNRGYGQALLKSVLQQAAATGVKTIELTVAAGSPAISMYEANGFVFQKDLGKISQAADSPSELMYQRKI